MILYLDTSALVKLYVREPGSSLVKTLVRRAAVVCSSRVAYPEARAAFARRDREGALRHGALARMTDALGSDFEAMAVVELGVVTARRAGDLAEQHGLRGFDAIHLASALELASLCGTMPTLCCFDARLAAGAAALGLAVVPVS